jgi:hypothetical protein
MPYAQRVITDAANTILEQLGGDNRLKAMIGIKDLFACTPAENPSESVNGPALVFKFRGSRKVNFCVITLEEGKDLYTMEIGQVIYSTGRVRYYYARDELQHDQLIPTFEGFTKLRLSL